MSNPSIEITLAKTSQTMEKYSLWFKKKNTQQPSQKLKTTLSYSLFSKGNYP